jgi:hypothetical protein
MRRGGSRTLRMIGGAICPPGFFCMDTGFIVFAALVLLAVAGFAYMHADKSEKEIKIVVEREERAPTYVQASSSSSGRDYRSPPSPERMYATMPDTRGFAPPPGVRAVPIQVPTQGYPEEYQQIGVLTAQGGSSTSASPNRTLLPLFGRRNATGRDRFNYYTRTDGFNPIQVSLNYKNRQCDDDNGCDEIFSGDTVSVPQLGQTFVSTVYKYNVPRYIPVV